MAGGCAEPEGGPSVAVGQRSPGGGTSQRKCSCPGEPCCWCEWRPCTAAWLPEAAAGRFVRVATGHADTGSSQQLVERAGPGMAQMCVRVGVGGSWCTEWRPVTFPLAVREHSQGTTSPQVLFRKAFSVVPLRFVNIPLWGRVAVFSKQKCRTAVTLPFQVSSSRRFRTRVSRTLSGRKVH